ncbi:hypothetical protein PICMEDRAFT_16871 [Pichia membranifaciens NRRL Y-2026]|uniref:Alpha-1,2-mannosyltransferase n=1 Tax=Pichia membranifaciens NRRL Y-2026 TaxID=763406 RepID=A0A1E3NHE6_9ASCO|nr:hypothetical protein PICMEDRAFT_16871 [Pichia membranifaciens NRRL Y-2026]ODQ45570.1 hypothetical protein PICMEDRAFT_16871 [Pichia membranifaciens NRRL Y-2026]
MRLITRKLKVLLFAIFGLLLLTLIISKQSATVSQLLEKDHGMIIQEDRNLIQDGHKAGNQHHDDTANHNSNQKVEVPESSLGSDQSSHDPSLEVKIPPSNGDAAPANDHPDVKNAPAKIQSGHHGDQEEAKGTKETKGAEDKGSSESSPKEMDTSKDTSEVSENSSENSSEESSKDSEGASHDNSDPQLLQDSSYAQSESENDLVDEDVVKEIIEEYVEEETKSKNPGEEVVDKDWTININEKLSKVTSEQFLKGSKVTKTFFSQLLHLIYGNRLSFPLEQRMQMENGKTIIDNILFYSENQERLSEFDCGTFMDFPDNFIEDLTIKHKIVVDNIPDIEPNFYSGSGYVIVGGGKYSWFAFLVIQTLRKLDAFLPVEVIIPSNDDYEAELCEKILPKYDARCVKLHDVFDAKLLDDIKVTGYQYKSLALLASSFENAFLLDSDNYPIINPDPLFISELYYDYTMITWPDYWRRTTSPKFYEVRGTKLGKRVRHLNDFKTDPSHFKVENEDDDEEILKNEVPMHDREGSIPDWTTESGEMLINKKIHFKALLLALYYNLDGQFGYYPLLSQGGAGEGDKETFVAASNFYNLKYYQVNKMPDRAYGFYKYGMFFDTSIIQYNPLKDYENLKKAYEGIKDKIEEEGESFNYDYTSLFTDAFRIDNSQPMFYHVHETKMDPFALYEENGTVDLDGKKLRNLGGDFPRVDFDLEKFLWQMIERYVCVENLNFAYFSGKDKGAVCGDFIKDQLKFLDESGYQLLKQYIETEPFENLKRTN